jgi:hypothetical protein
LGNKDVSHALSPMWARTGIMPQPYVTAPEMARRSLPSSGGTETKWCGAGPFQNQILPSNSMVMGIVYRMPRFAVEAYRCLLFAHCAASTRGACVLLPRRRVQATASTSTSATINDAAVMPIGRVLDQWLAMMPPKPHTAATT